MKKRLRHSITFFVLVPLIRIFLRIKFRYKGIKFKSDKTLKGPYLILSNHALALDPFLLSMSFKGPIFFVASDMIFSIPFWSKIIRYLVSPIPKTKYRSDMATVRDMLKMVKSGGTIGLFPEGNATFHGKLMRIDPSVIKLMRLLKVPVLLYTITGGYLSKPRWAKHSRKGRIEGRVKTVITPETIKSLSDDALYELVLSHLTVDEYAFQAKHAIPYKGKALAEDIESSYFYCPSCHQLHTLTSELDKAKCTQCDFAVQFLPNGRFKPLYDGPYYETTYPWYKAQEEALKTIIDDPTTDFLFEDVNEAVLDVERSKRKTPIGQATIRLSKETFEIAIDGAESQFIPVNKIQASAQQKNKLIIYDQTSQKTYYFINHPKRNALKYVMAIDILKGAN